MTETHDPETGEIVSAGMPPAIASALCKVMMAAKQLGYDSSNAHSNYKYVSADKFFSVFGPICADAGLVIIMDEDSAEIAGATGKDGKVSSWLKTRYKFTFAHESGAVYGPVFRTVMVLANGAQAFGSAQTYLLKQFLRATFLVPTGERDEVDDQPSDELPRSGAVAPSAPPKPQTAQPSPPQSGAPSSGFTQKPGSTRTKSDGLTIDGTRGTEFKPPNPSDLDYARSAFTSIRQQIAQATSVEDVAAVITANGKQLEDIKRIAGAPHWQKLMDSANARKDMLAPEADPEP